VQDCGLSERMDQSSLSIVAKGVLI
jgi:hypothetical protein